MAAGRTVRRLPQYSGPGGRRWWPGLPWEGVGGVRRRQEILNELSRRQNPQGWQGCYHWGERRPRIASGSWWEDTS